MNPERTLAELAANPERVSEVPEEELPEVWGALERLRAEVWRRLARPPAPNGDGPPEPEEPDRLLTVEELAERLSVSERYVYDHADGWPFTRKPSPNKLRFSARGFKRWLRTR